MGLSNGQRLGPYEILAPIGAGGMGEVYKARDTRLGRDVAIKVLPAGFAADPERLRRFEQEARATAALDHPNILAVFDIGTHEGTPYIVEQLLEGETLRERLRGGPLPPGKAVDFGVQIAQGLAAAHGKGIVHRDLKPENLFITEDGRIKILDFGLARLRAPETPQPEGRSEAATADSPTREGRILGTPGYMSPEQVRGKPVDARTDIFAFGVVLYEMLSGNRAFEGDTAADTQAAILTKDPSPLPPITPASLDRVVRRCIEKRPEDRFSSAHDLAFALEAVSGSGAAISTPAAGVQVTLPRPRHLVAGAAAAVLVLLAVAVVTAVYTGRGKKKASLPFEHVKVTRVTGDGRAGNGAAISPDGRYVAYVQYDSQGRGGLWVQQVATSSAVRLVATSGLRGPSFSRDGNYVYYLSRVAGRDLRQLHRVPSIGGTPEPQPIEDLETPVTFSPDGKQLAFVRATLQDMQLLIVNADGTGERKLAAGGVGLKPSWSPDGSTIAWACTDGEKGFVQLVDARTGAARRLGEKRWGWIGEVEWMADGKNLLFTAAEKGGNSSPSQVWLMDCTSGAARMVMSDVASYVSVSVSADGRSMVATKTDLRSGLWVAPLDDPEKAVQLGQESYAGDGGNVLAWTPDGGLIYNSAAGDQQDIWIADRPGGQPRRITNDPFVELNAAVSPDGRTIVFLDSPRNQAKSKAIWRLGIDGGGRKVLVPSSDMSVFRPLVTADGRWVIYYSEKETNYSFLGRVYRVPIEGGAPEPLGAGDPVKLKRFEGFLSVALSPDGRTLGGLSSDGQKLYLTVLPLDGSRPPAKLATLEGIWAEMAFAPDGRSLIYHDYRDAIWRQALDGSPPQRLIRLEGKQLYNLAVWNQGRQIAYAAGSESRDVVLIQETKGE